MRTCRPSRTTAPTPVSRGRYDLDWVAGDGDPLTVGRRLCDWPPPHVRHFDFDSADQIEPNSKSPLDYACHGPLVLAAADLVDGRRIAGFTACRDDVITMGARYDFAWPAMIDGNIVTGRVPDDVPEFVDAITDALSGSHLIASATPATAEVTSPAP